jgi:hypothetical protein
VHIRSRNIRDFEPTQPSKLTDVCNPWGVKGGGTSQLCLILCGPTQFVNLGRFPPQVDKLVSRNQHVILRKAIFKSGSKASSCHAAAPPVSSLASVPSFYYFQAWR